CSAVRSAFRMSSGFSRTSFTRLSKSTGSPGGGTGPRRPVCVEGPDITTAEYGDLLLVQFGAGGHAPRGTGRRDRACPGRAPASGTSPGRPLLEVDPAAHTCLRAAAGAESVQHRRSPEARAARRHGDRLTAAASEVRGRALPLRESAPSRRRPG